MTVVELQSYIQKNIDKLPPEKLEELRETFDKILEEVGEKEPKKKRQAGTMKGSLKYMAPDFDAPMEEFKDYM